MLLAYKFARAGDARVQAGVIAATGGIAIVTHQHGDELFFHTQMSFLYAATPLGIGISLFVVIIASLNLIIDFDMIETGARVGAPKSHGVVRRLRVMVTLIWLYMEILRLLSKFAGAKTRREAGGDAARERDGGAGKDAGEVDDVEAVGDVGGLNLELKRRASLR